MTPPPTTQMPWITSAVRSGFPSPAGDYHEKRIVLNKELIDHPLSIFPSP